MCWSVFPWPTPVCSTVGLYSSPGSIESKVSCGGGGGGGKLKKPRRTSVSTYISCFVVGEPSFLSSSASLDTSSHPLISAWFLCVERSVGLKTALTLFGLYPLRPRSIVIVLLYYKIYILQHL